MSLTKKQWLIIGGIGAFLAIGLIVGVTLSVLLGRREPSTESIQSRVHQILEENPLIDGYNKEKRLKINSKNFSLDTTIGLG